MHYYQDVSHFRAPYKNVQVAGFGATIDGGEPIQTPPPAPPPETGPSPLDASVEQTPDGLWRFKPAVSKQIIKNLTAFNAIYMTPERVALQPWSKEQADYAAKDSAYAKTLTNNSGATWVGKQLKAGNIVFASASLIAPYMPESKPELGAVPAKDTARLQEIAAMGEAGKMAPILVDPRSSSDKALVASAGIHPVVIVVGIAAVVGVGLYAYKKKKEAEDPWSRWMDDKRKTERERG